VRRGLVIGKFMPVHEGHLALIRFGAEHCDELIVSMSYTNADAIDPQLRFTWLQKIFEARPNVKPALVKDDFDDETLPLEKRTEKWGDFIRRTYPKIDIIFSSEDYGAPFARHLNAVHRLFDRERKQVPVSASLIRKKPFRYWRFIPEVVRPYFVKKICFYGPESTGKSYMAKHMAEKYETTFVPEVAREMITTNDFTVDDIIRIGKAHHQRIEERLKIANKILFCDTDAITTQLYSQYYLGVTPPVLTELEHDVSYDVYFLFDVDVPWVADGLRDLGLLRQEMFQLFKQALDHRNIVYTHVHGDWQQREKIIGAEIDRLLQ
jgi:HTH-type transcriptional regulator, transcriptional repressor of NAD biosynthesis genes